MQIRIAAGNIGSNFILLYHMQYIIDGYPTDPLNLIAKEGNPLTHNIHVVICMVHPVVNVTVHRSAETTTKLEDYACAARLI